jgi:hypothetical protein
LSFVIVISQVAAKRIQELSHRITVSQRRGRVLVEQEMRWSFYFLGAIFFQKKPMTYGGRPTSDRSPTITAFLLLLFSALVVGRLKAPNLLTTFRHIAQIDI